MLDEAGQPVRVYDYTEHTLWVCGEGRGWDIRDEVPNSPVRVRTYFSAKAILRNSLPPMFVTGVHGLGSTKYFETPTWEEAEVMHARVLAKAKRKVAERVEGNAGRPPEQSKR